MNYKTTGFTHVSKASVNSLKGLKACFQNEAGFRHELFLSLFLVPASFYFGKNSTEIALLLLTIFLVLIAELLNTGIEAVADRISLEKHPLIAIAKDCGSAAVFLAMMLFLLVWGIIIFL